MGIAALSLSRKQVQLMQNVSLAAANQVRGFQEQKHNNCLKPHPKSGYTTDVFR